MVLCAEKTNHKLHDEMPTHDLAEYKVMGDSTGL